MAKVEIVPFGKYKGQPVDAMAQDKAYCDWLSSQDWFRTRFTAIHTLIVNNFGVPDETPEHNALQARFTDKEWVVCFIRAVATDAGIQQAFEFGRNQELYGSGLVRGDYAGLEVQLQREVTHLESLPTGEVAEWVHPYRITAEAKIVELRAKIKSTKQATPIIKVGRLSFESTGADVALQSINLGTLALLPDYRVECKPVVGDDYPGILRQMKASSCNVLLIGDGGYQGTGATFEQVVTIFKSSGIKIILLGDVSGQVDLAPREQA